MAVTHHSSNERRPWSPSASTKDSAATRGLLLAVATACIGFAVVFSQWGERPSSRGESRELPVRAIEAGGSESPAPRIAIGAASTGAAEPTTEGPRSDKELAESAPTPAAIPFVAGSPRFGAIPEDAARAFVESVSRHHELAQVMWTDARTPAATRACLDFLFSVWPEIDALIERGLVKVEAIPFEAGREVSARRVLYAKDESAKTLAVSIWHERWTGSIRFSAGGSAQKAFEALFDEAGAGSEATGR